MQDVLQAALRLNPAPQPAHSLEPRCPVFSLALKLEQSVLCRDEVRVLLARPCFEGVESEDKFGVLAAQTSNLYVYGVQIPVDLQPYAQPPTKHFAPPC
jgi:hypothetical protein